MFEKSYKDVMKLAESLGEEQLFTKGMYPWVGGSVLGHIADEYCVEPEFLWPRQTTAFLGIAATRSDLE